MIRGKEGGDSPGYGITLVAETTSGALLSAERVARTSSGGAELPENVGRGVAQQLLLEIFKGGHSPPSLPPSFHRTCRCLALTFNEYPTHHLAGGVIDSAHQPLLLHLMVLTAEDVSKIRCGPLTPQAVLQLRLLREMYDGLTFKIKIETHQHQIEHHRQPRGEKEAEEEEEESSTDSRCESSHAAAAEQFEAVQRSTVLLSCCGIGYSNIYRKAT